MLWYVAFTMGLVGSLHCLGMCGPIAMALPVRTSHIGLKTLKYLLYNSGRIITYSLLGMLIGTIGAGFVFAGLQQVLSVACGVVVIASVFILYSPWQQGMELILSPLKKKVREAFAYCFKRGDHAYSMFALGMLNGLLPCGMVYAALFGALASGGVVYSALFMAFFGLGTLPIMMAAGFAGSFINQQTRQLFNKMTPILAVLIGVFLILRGLSIHLPFDGPVVVKNAVYTCH